MFESIRFEYTKLYNVTISRNAGQWFISYCFEVVEKERVRENQTGIVGIDLGVKDMAVLSDGCVYENPHIEQRFRKKVRQCQKALARKKKGSKNWHKAKRKLQRLYQRIANVRRDYIHKFTTAVSQKYETVCLEDLNVSGMVRNHKLAKALQDVSFYEIRRQFEYKAGEVRYVPPFFASSKTCSHCGHIQEMPLEKRVYRCESCGAEINRDLNAAINIVRSARPKTAVGGKPVDMQALAMGQMTVAKLA
ncbi:hypothetical protein FACS1894200_02050 [Spirochaetia bacterium]|nr:hypothetical protein FACS1894200_02050 [Spirochaetia bacterium]